MTKEFCNKTDSTDDNDDDDDQLCTPEHRFTNQNEYRWQ